MSPPGPRMLADEMLGKLARDLRILGYDVAYAHHVDDEAILARAREEDRLLLTRDRRLAEGSPRAVLLQTRDPEEQLARIIDQLELSPHPEVFLSRCLECNRLVEEADVPERLPDDVSGQRHWICPSCDRVYWRGTHAEDMLERLGEHLPDDTDPDLALDPSGDAGEGERKP